MEVPSQAPLKSDHTLIAQHQLDLVLCKDLERLADNLPHLPSEADLKILTETLSAASLRWQDKALCGPPLDGAAWAARLTDSLHAEDVIDALWQYRERRPPMTVGQLSYMLRALFDGRMRTMALECALIQNEIVNPPPNA